MFALTMGPGMNFGFPDVCKTPPFAEPIPYPNISESTTSAPAAYNVLIDCMPTLNQTSLGLVSEGDDAGVMMGLISEDISGMTPYLVGCFTIMADGPPVQRLTSVTGCNAMGMLLNGPGMCICPSQTQVLTLG